MGANINKRYSAINMGFLDSLLKMLGLTKEEGGSATGETKEETPMSEETPAESSMETPGTTQETGSSEMGPSTSQDMGDEEKSDGEEGGM